MRYNSKLFRGEVVHERLVPEQHRFSYPMTFFGFDLNELPLLGESLKLFGYNQAGVLSLWDKDYLRGRSDPIGQQLAEFLPPCGEGEYTLLITSPKYFGYAFNPVNFHLRIANGTLIAVVAEVNNTFGDRHLYPLTDLEKTGEHTWIAQCAKDFHVSPFNDLEGAYHFSFCIENKSIFLGVDLHKDGQVVMKTWLSGKAHDLSTKRVLVHALAHPWDTAVNSLPRIVWQAALLFYKRKLVVFRRPKPYSPFTVIDRDMPEGERPVV